MKTKHMKAVAREEVRSKFLICKRDPFSDVKYELLQVFEGETWSEVKDKLDDSTITVVKRDGTTVNTAGEPCGEFETIGEARIHMYRLEKIYEVMES